MATWIWPFCEHRMQVQPNHIGKDAPSQKCQQESTIIDDDDAKASVRASLTHVTPSPEHRGTHAAKGANAILAASIGQETPLVITFIKSILLLGAVLGVALCIFGLYLFSSFVVLTGAAFVGQILFLWPITIVTEECVRSRRLLQAILANQ